MNSRASPACMRNKQQTLAAAQGGGGRQLRGHGRAVSHFILHPLLPQHTRADPKSKLQSAHTYLAQPPSWSVPQARVLDTLCPALLQPCSKPWAMLRLHPALAPGQADGEAHAAAGISAGHTNSCPMQHTFL